MNSIIAVIVAFIGLGLSFIPVKLFISFKETRHFLLGLYAILIWNASIVAFSLYILMIVDSHLSQFILLTLIIILYLILFSYYVYKKTSKVKT